MSKLPAPSESIIDRNGQMSNYWRRYFQDHNGETVNLTQIVQQIQQTVQNPSVHLGTVIGLDGIVVTGDLSTQLVIRFPGGGGAGLALSDTAPENTTKTPFWVDTTDGTLYIWYDDGTSAQWVVFGSAGGGSAANLITYDNTTSGLTADDVQAAIDELAAAGGGGGSGDVVGPASAVNNHVAFFDGTTGKLLKDSGLTLSGTNTGDQTSVTGNAGTATALATSRNIDGQAFNGTADITVIAPGTHAATSKATPVDADELPLVDSAASNVLKRLTWANLKATLFASSALTGNPTAPTPTAGDNDTSIATTAFVTTAVAAVSGGSSDIRDFWLMG